jgi:hypothetical protein
MVRVLHVSLSLGFLHLQLLRLLDLVLHQLLFKLLIFRDQGMMCLIVLGAPVAHLEVLFDDKVDGLVVGPDLGCLGLFPEQLTPVKFVKLVTEVG